MNSVITECVFEVLKEINLDVKYIELCQQHNNFDNRYNLKKNEVEPLIKSLDPNFKYLAKDRTFLREVIYQNYMIRFFIDFKGGVIDFSYLIWKEGENDNFHKGRLATLVESLDPQFESKIKYRTPIATSLSDFEEILYEIFSLFRDFEFRFSELRGFMI